MITIDAIHIGQPQSISGESGVWRSSIFRQPVSGPIELGQRGLIGDQVTDTKNHGSPDQAVCCHLRQHYDYWNELYGLSGERALGPGSVGENWTLLDADEAEICVGDIFAVGSARVQVTGSRIPCTKQDRKLKLPDFQKRTLEVLRTGFYLRVLTPGMVQAGDVWTLEARPQPALTLHVLNVCAHYDFDSDLARQLVAAPELSAGWRRILQHMSARVSNNN